MSTQDDNNKKLATVSVHDEDGVKQGMTVKKQKRSLQVIFMEIIAFCFIIFISWANEIFHLSQRIFGGNYTPDWHEAAFESVITVLVAIPTILFTWQVVRRLHHLEGFLRLCAWCRKIASEEEWLSIEEYFDSEFKTQTSHGLCPTCLEDLKSKS